MQRDVSRETCEKLEAYKALLIEENERQNLISKATIDEFDQRHLIDSAQLLTNHADPAGKWLDVGSGAGLPGIVLATLHPGSVTLVEPRRLRAEFLRRVVDDLTLSNATVHHKKVEQVTDAPTVITGRAVANVSKFLSLTEHLTDLSTHFVLPKGRKAAEELEAAKKVWQGRFELVPSVTDAEASILLASGIKRRGKR
nr:16S rRNA (guanine(527)-N(7))-methyltransferase RsmG [Sphingomicrobium sp. B8]